jgi:hypothetical protein
MNTNPTIFIDKAGKTGSNILNRNQPYFVLSVVHFTKAESEQLCEYIKYDREQHSVEMKKSFKGRSALSQYCNIC